MDRFTLERLRVRVLDSFKKRFKAMRRYKSNDSSTSTSNSIDATMAAISTTIASITDRKDANREKCADNDDSSNITMKRKLSQHHPITPILQPTDIPGTINEQGDRNTDVMPLSI